MTQLLHTIKVLSLTQFFSQYRNKAVYRTDMHLYVSNISHNESYSVKRLHNLL